METHIVVTQKRSLIGQDKRHHVVMRALGLKRIGHTVELSDTAAIRGMVTKVQHLIEVSLKAGAKTKGAVPVKTA
jgi:large subunit ribosomal protein L30